MVLIPAKPHTIRYTFSKDERLCSQKIISGLFQPGFFISRFPFRVNVLFTELPVQSYPAQVVFMVSKKKFRRAVDRNKVKRVLRELYRLKKHRIYDALKASGKTAAIAVFWSSAEFPEYHIADLEFDKIIEKLIHAIHHQ